MTIIEVILDFPTIGRAERLLSLAPEPFALLVTHRRPRVDGHGVARREPAGIAQAQASRLRSQRLARQGVDEERAREAAGGDDAALYC